MWVKAPYAPGDRRDRGKGQYWNGSVSRFRVSRLSTYPSANLNGHTLSVFQPPSSWVSVKSIRTSLQRGTDPVAIGFRNDPLCGGGARVVSMPDVQHLFHSFRLYARQISRDGPL